MINYRVSARMTCLKLKGNLYVKRVGKQAMIRLSKNLLVWLFFVFSVDICLHITISD